jgi:hypothetical protein
MTRRAAMHPDERCAARAERFVPGFCRSRIHSRTQSPRPKRSMLRTMPLAVEKQGVTSQSPWETVTALRTFRRHWCRELTRTYHGINHLEDERLRWTNAIWILPARWRDPHDSSSFSRMEKTIGDRRRHASHATSVRLASRFSRY